MSTVICFGVLNLLTRVDRIHDLDLNEESLMFIGSDLKCATIIAGKMIYAVSSRGEQIRMPLPASLRSVQLRMARWRPNLTAVVIGDGESNAFVVSNTGFRTLAGVADAHFESANVLAVTSRAGVKLGLPSSVGTLNLRKAPFGTWVRDGEIMFRTKVDAMTIKIGGRQFLKSTLVNEDFPIVNVLMGRSGTFVISWCSDRGQVGRSSWVLSSGTTRLVPHSYSSWFAGATTLCFEKGGQPAAMNTSTGKVKNVSQSQLFVVAPGGKYGFSVNRRRSR